MKKFKVYLLDDHKLIRDGLKSILGLSDHYVVAGDSGDPKKFIQQLHEIDFDIILLDISFSDFSGFDLIKPIKTAKPDSLIVMLTMHLSSEYMLKCLKEGANSYLIKDIDPIDLIKSLDIVREKKIYFPYSMENKVAESVQDTGNKFELSQREMEVLSLMSEGLSSKQIANTLQLSSRTIETHRLNIMKKLGTSNSAETISVASKNNLIR